MKLLTPAEYHDAWDYLQEQDTRMHAIEVENLISPHATRIEAEVVRRVASAEWLDQSALIAARRQDLIEADDNHRARRVTA